MNKFRTLCAATLAVALIAATSQATLITFTGGTVVRLDTSVETTDTTITWDNVDYYEESGFRLDFTPNSAGGFSTNIGNYYGAGNDVIHSHWETGNYGTVALIEITKIGGGTFDLNYFTLTSNTDFGGGPASGNEQAWVRGYLGGSPVTVPHMLPSEDWGFPATQVGLGGGAFDVVDSVIFYVTNPVDCFGMDDFFIDEIPEPTTFVLFSLMGGLMLGTRRVRRSN